MLVALQLHDVAVTVAVFLVDVSCSVKRKKQYGGPLVQREILKC